MKNALFTLMMLGMFTFAHQAEARTMSSIQPLPKNELSTFYGQFFNLAVEKTLTLSSEGLAPNATQEEAPINTPNVACEDEVTYPSELAEEGVGCRVRDESGQIIASCFICNCAKLVEAAQK